jgi:ABC-2 type transport system permease protein
MNTWRMLFRRELRRIITDRRLLMIMLGGPFLYGFLFGGVYWNGRVRDIPIVIVDQDHSALSRDLARALLSSESLSLAFYSDSVGDFYEAVKRERAYACVVLPKDLERNVLRGEQGRVAVILDGSNILIGNMTSRAISSTIASYRAQARARRLMATGVSRRQATVAAAPIQPVVRSLFNPAAHYNFFILIGLVLIALQQVTRIGAAISLSLDSEPARRRELATIGGHPGILLTAKLAATAVAILPIAFVAIRLPFDLFGSPFQGNWILSYAILTLYMLMQVLIGYGVSGMCGSALFSLQVLVFVSAPLFTLAGFTWPSYAMPAGCNSSAR